MERTEAVTLANMCMIYDNNGNVLVEEKITSECKGIIFPGGHVERHEPIVDATIREVWEETGLTVSNLHLCGIKEFVEDNGSRYMVFLYKTNTYSGELKSSVEGRVFWMPLDELKNINPLWHLDKMLEIFCGEDYSELYFVREDTMSYKMVLK